MEFKDIIKGYFWSAFSSFMERVHFSSDNKKKLSLVFKHLSDPKGSQFLSFNRPLGTVIFAISSCINWCQSSEFQGGKLNFLNFAGLLCCFFKNNSFSPADLIFVLEQTFSILKVFLYSQKKYFLWEEISGRG